MKLSRLRVGTRLAIGFSSVLLLLVLIAGTGAWRLHQEGQDIRTMVDVVMQKERLASEWASNIDVNGARTFLVAELTDVARQKEVQAKMAELVTSTSAIQKALEAFDKTEEEAALLAEIGEKRKVYSAARSQFFADKTGDDEGALRASRLKMEAALVEYVGAVKKVTAYQAASLAATAHATTTRSRTSQWLLAVLGALAILTGVAVALVIARSIRMQLGGEPSYAAEIANRVARGDLSTAIETRAGDQGSLLHAMKAMQEQLVALVAQVRIGTDTIATASSEIASGNTDLSSRTEEQASSLEETAASMEELTSTVKQNADNAQQANELAVAASDVAARGGAVVSQVVETMGSIEESARKIVDIISVIDGIAFQTNILALNAAVEAARAGEQGRGFAVVASEVRSLAQRSAAAAKEIKTLIGDSVDKVGVGSKLVQQAGATMDEVVASVRRVTGIMSEITTASQEQSAGIEQVNQAITQMDQVTQQNAALVQQSAAAAESMQDQARSLEAVVALFRLGDEAQQTASTTTSTSSAASRDRLGGAQQRQELAVLPLAQSEPAAPGWLQRGQARRASTANAKPAAAAKARVGGNDVAAHDLSPSAGRLAVVGSDVWDEF